MGSNTRIILIDAIFSFLSFPFSFMAGADPYRIVGGTMELNAFALAAMSGRRSALCRMLEHSPTTITEPQQLLSLEEIGRIFADDGMMAHLKGFETRDEQVRMALAVAEAFNHDRVVLVEAGAPLGPADFHPNDVGKTLSSHFWEGGARTTRGNVVAATLQPRALGGGTVFNSSICMRALPSALERTSTA
jgi:hypothetical protein